MNKLSVAIRAAAAAAFFFSTAAAGAQELRCNVIINDQLVQNKNPQAKEEMQASLKTFMNTTKWTEDKFEEIEKIECTFAITLAPKSDATTGDYIASAVQIQSTRPVYGTDYESTVLNTFDTQWEFKFLTGQPLTFAENIYTNEITSLMSFYAYLIIGLDYDSFRKEGGTRHFEQCQAIATNAQQGLGLGWKSRDIRDRYNLVANLLDPRHLIMRENAYAYYRQGLDNFADSPAKSQELALKSVQGAEKVFMATQSSLLVKVFFDTKAVELVNIFKGAKQEIKDQAVPLLRKMDPTNTSKYNSILME